jgi:hypothetical protein
MLHMLALRAPTHRLVIEPELGEIAEEEGEAARDQAFVPSGAQQWMCAAVSGVVRPKKDAITWSVCAVGSSTTTTVPAPGEATGGTSFAPLSGCDGR